MKVSELSGAKLDYWVAKADGKTLTEDGDGGWFDEDHFEYSPSSDWSQGGPIIEREKIDTAHNNLWYALHNAAFTDERQMKELSGSTALIAAMRCYVASKFGEEVPDEPTS